jgi:peptidyl-prolyl cis-trans isomerase D
VSQLPIASVDRKDISMLQKIRDSITGWVATVVLMLLVIPFAFWGVDSYFGASAVNWAAKVDGVDISTTELTQEYQARLSRLQQVWGDSFDSSLIDDVELRRSALDVLINDTLLTERVIRDRYTVSDRALIEQIQAMTMFQVGGEFDADAYDRLIRTQSSWGTPERFEEAFRQSLAKQQLQSAIVASSFALPSEAERSQALRVQQRQVTWLEFNTAAFAPTITVTDEEIASYYASNQDDYLTEEMVDIAYVTIGAEDLRADAGYTEAELHAFYLDRANQQLAPERRFVRHILIDSGSDGLEAAQATIASLRDRIEAGEDFSALAAEYSTDAGSAPAGGELGWVEEEMLPGAFGSAVFSMAEGELRGPVSSEFGAHLILVEQIEAPTALPFEEVRAEIEVEFQQIRAEERYYDLRERLADLSFQNPTALEPVADALGLELQFYNGLTRQGGDFGITTSDDVVRAAFDPRVAEEGENSDPLELDGRRVVVLRVTRHQPAVPHELAEVMDDVRQDLIQERANELARAEAERVAAALAEGADAAALAAGSNGILTEDLVITRAGVGISPWIVRAAFSAPRPVGGVNWTGAVEVAGGHAALMLTHVMDGPVDEEATLIRRGQLETNAGNSEFNTYVDDLRAAADVSIREEALEQP